MNKFLTLKEEKKIYHFAQKDEKILKLILNNMRGGICSRSKLTYMNVYNKPGEHIVYLDMNNLYGKAMMLSLPVAGYELDEKEYESKDILDWMTLPEIAEATFSNVTLLLQITKDTLMVIRCSQRK
jgi:hypothetical protein